MVVLVPREFYKVWKVFVGKLFCGQKPLNLFNFLDIFRKIKKDPEILNGNWKVWKASGKSGMFLLNLCQIWKVFRIFFECLDIKKISAKSGRLPNYFRNGP